MTKRLYDVLKDCNKEEEVKSEFCKFFKMKINALKSIDHYTPTILFEFKYDRNFKNSGAVAHVIAQTMYYARLLKFSLTKCALPPYICVVDKKDDGRFPTPAAVDGCGAAVGIRRGRCRVRGERRERNGCGRRSRSSARCRRSRGRSSPADGGRG